MLTVAYLGPENTNAHVAAQAKFGKRADYLHAPTIEDVFHLVERRKADYGVVPIENSLEGAVTHTLDRFIDFVDTPVSIHGEIEQPIQHALFVHRGVKLEDIQLVFSHPQALAQCRQWLKKHLSRARPMETDSTAEAIQRMKKGGGEYYFTPISDRVTRQLAIEPQQRAAIARPEFSKDKDLEMILIPDMRENKTRFLILGLGEPNKDKRNNKTSILFALKDKPGALHDALVPFKKNKINLTKIESRPSKRKAWEYVFFIDIAGHESDAPVVRALNALERSTSVVRVLGSYPVAVRKKGSAGA